MNHRTKKRHHSIVLILFPIFPVIITHYQGRFHCSFLLRKINLIKIIQVRLKSQGYDRGGVSAYSAVFFLDPKFLRSKDGIIQMGPSIGFQDLWEKLVEVHDMKVVYNTSVEAVEYLENDEGDGYVNLSTTNKMTGKSETQRFDFCIIDIPEPLKILANPSPNQEMCLSKFVNFSPVLTLIFEMEGRIDHQVTFDNQSKFIDVDHLGLCTYRKRIDEVEEEGNDILGRNFFL